MENLAQEWFLAYFSYEIQGYLLFKQTTEKKPVPETGTYFLHMYMFELNS